MQNRQWPTVDEEDVAISAFRSFCVGVQHGKFSDVVHSGQVWGILAALTSNKAIDWTRYHLAKKRDGERHLTARGGDSQAEPWDNVVDPAAAPADELAIAEETCQQMVQQLRDAVLQEIALMKLEGMTNEQIAEKLGCACRTVERKLNVIRQLWGEPS